MNKVVLVTASSAGMELARYITSNPTHFADFLSVIEKVEVPKEKPFDWIDDMMKQWAEEEKNG